MEWNLKGYLANSGMSVVEFADLLGYNHNYMYRVVRGATRPSYYLAEKIFELTDGVIRLEIYHRAYKRNIKYNNDI